MNIIDTLVVLIKGDTSDLEKKSEQAKKQTDGLNAKLKDTKQVGDQVSGTFGDIATYLTDMVTSAVSFYAIVESLKGAAKFGMDLNISAKNLGTNAKDLATYGAALENFGGNAQSFKANLQGISSATGLSPDNVIKLLPALAESFKKLPRQLGLLSAQRVGVDLPLYNLLAQTKDINALVKSYTDLGTITKEDQKQFNDLTSSLSLTKYAFEIAGEKIDTKLIPSFIELQKALRWVAKYFIDNPDFGVGLLGGTAIAALITGFALIGVEAVAMAAAVTTAIVAFAKLYEFLKTHSFKEIFSFPHLQSSGDKKLDEMFGIGKKPKEQTKEYKQFNDHWNNFFKDIFSPLHSYTGFIAKSFINTASNTPFNSLSSSSINNGNNSNITVNAGDITIETQSTDPRGIALEFKNLFNTHMGAQAQHWNNGVQA